MWVADVVGEQELPDGERGFVGLEDLVRVGLACDPAGGVFDFLHALHVLAEIGFEGGVDGTVVDGDQRRVGGRSAEGEGHGDFGAHGVADEDWGWEGVGADEVFDVLGHGGVGVSWTVGGFAMVA